MPWQAFYHLHIPSYYAQGRVQPSLEYSIKAKRESIQLSYSRSFCGIWLPHEFCYYFVNIPQLLRV